MWRHEAPDVLPFADNALSHPREIAGYLAAVWALPGFESTIIPVGKGLSVAYRAGVVSGDQTSQTDRVPGQG